MGYSRNPKMIERSRTFLDAMLAAKDDIAWNSENSHMLGYYIREALTLAKRFDIAPYNELKDKFIIKDKGDRVVAELRLRIPVLRHATGKLTLSELTSVQEIVGACIEHKSEEMYFPNASLSEDDVKTLHTWTEKNNYFIISAPGGELTVTRKDPGDIKWMPT